VCMWVCAWVCVKVGCVVVDSEAEEERGRMAAKSGNEMQERHYHR